MSPDPQILHLRAVALLACVTATLNGTEFGSPPGCVVWGDVAWECTCDTGQLWVRLVRTYTVDGSFPAPQSVPSNCSTSMLAAEYEVGILRCMTVMVDGGKPPTCAQQTADAIKAASDMYAIFRGLYCCLVDWEHDLHDPVQGLILNQSAIGPAGNCGGSVTSVVVTVPDGYCC